MTTDKKNRREWFIFIVILIIGIFLLQFAASMASSEPEEWRVLANIESGIDPDREYSIKLFSELAPVKPEIMTPPAWNIRDLLTPEPVDVEKESIIPIANFHQSPTPTVNNAQVVAQPITETQNPPNGKSNNEPAPSISSATPTEEIAAAGNPVGSPTVFLTNPINTPTPTNIIFTSTSTATQQPTATPTLTRPSFSTATITPTNPPLNNPPPQPTKKPKPTKKPRLTKKNP